MTEEIVGPFGLWWFPILNRLLAIFQNRKLMTPQIQALPAPDSRDVARAHNRETWEWTDYKGRDRKITVHREVEQTG